MNSRTDELVRRDRIRAMAKQYLREFEPIAERSLAGVSLLCEVPANTPEITVERATKATRYLGLAMEGHDRSGRERVLEEYSAGLAIFIGLFAQTGYVHGGFWPQMGRQTGLPENVWHQTESVVKHQFRATLLSFGLPWIEGRGGNEYISNVALHSGIPNYCLEDWFRMLEQASNQVGSTPSAVLGWCRRGLDRSVLGYVDNPVRYIVQHGGQFVIDLAERSLETIGIARSSPTLPADSDEFARLGLSERFAQGALDWVHMQPRSKSRVVSSETEGAEVGRPAIRLKPWDQEVVVSLPQVVDPPRGFSWAVRQDDSEAQFVQPAESLGGSRISTSDAEMLVSKPVRMVEVRPAVGRLAASDPMHRNLLPLVNPDEPLLVFDEAGQLVDRTSEVPAKPVWLLVQPDSAASDHSSLEGVGIKVSGGFRLLDVADSPLGWGTWDLFRVDLSRAASLSFGQGVVRRVAQRRSAVIEIGSVQGSVLLGRTPVATARPRVILPQDYEGQWRVTATRVGDDRPSAEIVASVGPDVERNEHGDVTFDPFATFEGPVVGSFDVVVRGALGRGARSSVTLAEGLRYQCDQRVRLFTRTGLTPCTVQVQMAGAEFKCEPLEQERDGDMAPLNECNLPFADADLERSVSVVLASGIQHKLTVRPASIAVAQGGSGIVPRWSHRPINIEADQLPSGEFRLRIPSDTMPRLNLVSGGKLIQVVEPNKTGTQSVNYSLAQVTEAVRAVGSASIELASGNASLLLARVAPVRLFQGGMSYLDDSGLWLQLTGFSGGEVESFVWACGAPWLGVLAAEPDSHGIIRLPDEWRGLDPFVVHLRVRDDWDPKPGPVIPEPLRDKLIWPASGTLRDRIAANGSIVESRIAGLTSAQLWCIVRFRDCLAEFAFPGASSLYPEPSMRAVRRMLIADSDRLSALAVVTPSPSEAVGLLCLAGLDAVAANWPSASALQQELLLNPLTCALSLTSIAIDDADAVGESLIAVNYLMGDSFTSILATGSDPYSAAGRFTTETDMLDAVPPGQFAEIVRQANLMPRALLDQDSRSSAALEVFEFRNKHPQNGPLAIQARGLVMDVENELKKAGMVESLRALRARTYPHAPTQWRGLAGGSFAWALAARHASHGNMQFLELFARYPAWSQAPFRMRKLAAIDLVLAELYAARFEHMQRASESRATDEE